ncbi:MAG: hypothetical protein WD278_11850 [Pirellulales bacterium]
MLRNMLAIVLAAGALGAGTAHAQWGNLTGKFVYDGKPPEPVKLDTTKEPMCGKHNLVNESLVVGKNGGLAHVVIYVRDKKVKVHPDYEATANDTLRFDNKNCRFEPHVMPIRLSQSMELHNSDAFSHNSNLQPIGDTGINPLISMGGAVTYQFRRAQNVPVPVFCNIHPWMKGWILPRDNPYVAVSAEDGTFEIANLPAGELEFQVWQEKAGYLVAKKEWKSGRFKLKIKDGDNDLGLIKVSPKLVEEK